MVLTNQLIAGREIKDDIRTSQCQIIAGGNGRPYIFTNLHAELHTIAGDEHLRFSTHVDTAASKIDIRWIQILGRGKPTFLIELCIVWQICLRHNTKDGSTLKYYCTIIE